MLRRDKVVVRRRLMSAFENTPQDGRELQDAGELSGKDLFSVYGVDLTSRLLLGTAQYPSPSVLNSAIEACETEVVTVSLR